ncbi:MAG: ABC transporter substrate-binding protein [Thermoplasmatota archaeon]
MKSRRILSVIIVWVFLVSSLSVVNTSSTAQTEFVDSITIEVRTDQTAAMDDVANGNLDVFLYPVPGKVYENVSDEWKEKMDTWRSIGSYNTMLYNPAHTVSPYECNVSSELQFNPFAIEEIRQAQNYLIDRGNIIDEIYDGYAEAQYLWISQRGPGYDEYFEEIVGEYGYNRSGDKEKGIQMVQDAMEEASNSSELQGELRKGDDSFWEYKPSEGSWEDIELGGLLGPTDLTINISEYQGDLLEDCGFKVNIKYRQLAINYLHETDPASLKWHFYPGAWHSSSARKYQETLAALMYTGWYGYMPGRYVEDADYRYGHEIDGTFYGNHALENITKQLVNGHIEDMDEYWNKMVKTSKIGLDESVRIFLVSKYDFYPYDKDKIISAATDVLTGWSDVFSPRTMRTTDGSLKVAQYYPEGVPFNGNWNELGGSSYRNEERQKKMLMDQGSVFNPTNGKPMPMRTDWTENDQEPMVEKDYDWINGTLQENIEVPSDAVVYNSSSDQWENVGENKKSAVKAEYDVVTGKWHSSANLPLRDVMGWHAWSWEMAFEDGGDDPYYHKEFGSKKRSFFNSIVGEKWDEENQTYTIWGNYTFPADSKIGYYYSIWPAVPYYQYQAVQFLINQDDKYIPDGTGTYSWSSGAQNWVDWLSKDQGENITQTLQSMIEKEYTPWFMKEENNAPITVSQDELNSEMQRSIDFYDEHEHLFVSNGPFLLNRIDRENQKTQMIRFTQEDGYSWPEDHWRSPRIGNLIVPGHHVPETVPPPQPLDVSFFVQIEEDYPHDMTRNVTADDEVTASIKLLNSSDEVVAEISPKLENSTFTGTFDTTGLKPGEYTVKFSGSIPQMIGNVTKNESVIIELILPNIPINNFEVTPSTVITNESVSITATAHCNNYPGTVEVYVEDELINSYNISPGEEIEIEEQYTFTSVGNYNITIGKPNNQKTVNVVKPIMIEEVSLSDDEIQKGDNIEITARITNNDDKEREVDIEIDGEAVKTLTVKPGTQNYTYEFEFDEKGTYEVTVGDVKAGDVKVKEETPGLALILMLLCLSLVAIYWSNKRNR